MRRLSLVVLFLSFLVLTLPLKAMAQEADLIVQSISTSPTSPPQGIDVTMTVTVKNQGAASAGSFYVDFYKDRATAPAAGLAGDVYCHKDSLAAGATTTCIGSVTYSPSGTYKMWAQVDTDDDVLESNEGNNIVGPQDLTVQPVTLTISKSGDGSGTVTSLLPGISCGADCSENYDYGTIVTLSADPADGSYFDGWSSECSGGEVTMLGSQTCTATFNLFVFFDNDSCSGAKEIGDTPYTDTMDTSGATTAEDDPPICAGSKGNTVWYKFTAPGNGTVTADTIGSEYYYDTVLAAYTGSCGSFTSVACNDDIDSEPTLHSSITFNVTAGTTYYFMVADWWNPGGGELVFNVDFTPDPVASLITKYYNDILDRAPEPGGVESWESEIDRIVSLGINIREGFIAVAKAFFTSNEYIQKGTDNATYVTDLYQAFLDRQPAQFEIDSWVSYIDQGEPRSVILNSFAFSSEFKTYLENIFGVSETRPENDLINDFYRGFLSRLPDTTGLNDWLAEMRTAQCQGAEQVEAVSEEIVMGFFQSPEYTARARTNSEFVGDCYDAILRRGAAPDEVNFWIDQLSSGATRTEVLQGFLASPEFQGRVNDVINAGCLP